MNYKTEALITMAKLAANVYRMDDEDSVSLDTGVQNVLRIEQLATDIVATQDPDVKYDKWNAVIGACFHLRHVYREFNGDMDGVATEALYDALTKAIGRKSRYHAL